MVVLGSVTGIGNARSKALIIPMVNTYDIDVHLIYLYIGTKVSNRVLCY
uniref:Uncharacterized protein n=1 Tax=Arundo donax TaxID=35708 RepID=A0A0A8YWK2_ARUDO